ncbi:uncharacterized protein LOC114475045 isoform X2 [Gouania willdenowi]|uniref:uncharacterized protein LOC114475045 isoform X2 n=1 Tax=Gouania willdenowi TaxID=441366 RepID=UPI0010559207|nr:uncharacterized protein LOC114475045 isoform X2 [Gouania willdenowi]
MRGPYKRKNRDSEDLSPGPGPGESRTSGLRTGVRCFSRNMYVGVRVRMPVKELLKNIRVAKGVDPQQIKERCDSSVKGEMKRVKSRSKVQKMKMKMKQQHSTNDELSIIIEVLEEDLRTSIPHLLLTRTTTSSTSPQNLLSWPSQDPPVMRMMK